ELSDGFGRVIQTRALAADVLFLGDGDPRGSSGLPVAQGSNGAAQGRPRGAAPNVVVSAAQRYDNKGRVVEALEPTFAAGWDRGPFGEDERGPKTSFFRDALGRVVRTVHPDLSEQRVLYGVPGDLAHPDELTPTPWETTTYDENDNAGRTHAAASSGYQSHWNTPTSSVIDALDRVVATTRRKGPSQDGDWLTTRTTYDIGGNILALTDALGRPAFRYVVDLLGRVLRADGLDAGSRRRCAMRAARRS